MNQAEDRLSDLSALQTVNLNTVHLVNSKTLQDDAEFMRLPRKLRLPPQTLV